MPLTIGEVREREREREREGSLNILLNRIERQLGFVEIKKRSLCGYARNFFAPIINFGCRGY